MNFKIHHIGYLVKNIDKATIIFTHMGYHIEQDTVHDDYRGVDIRFLNKDGYRVELVSTPPPRLSSENSEGYSVVRDLYKKIGNSPYHICYEVDDLQKAIEELGKKHFVIWEEDHEAPAIDGHKVAFLVHGQIGIIELLEMEK